MLDIPLSVPTLIYSVIEYYNRQIWVNYKKTSKFNLCERILAP